MPSESDTLQPHSGDKREKIKSHNAELHSYITFYNRTFRTIDIQWCNYSGQEVMYKTLEPKQEMSATTSDGNIGQWRYHSYSVNTFVSHPWVARDANTGALLRVNQKKYYLPVAYDGEQHRTPVFIDIPVFGLKDRCLEVIRKLMNVDQLSCSEIPLTLLLSLKENIADSFITYEDYVNQDVDHG